MTKNILLRRTSKTLLVFQLITTVCAMGMLSFLLNNVYYEDIVSFYKYTAFIMILLGIPMLVMVFITLHEYCTKIEISENGISITYPTQKRIIIDRDRISAMGRIAFVRMNSKFFFCTAPKSEILDFYQNHNAECRRMFGRKRMERLTANDKETWKMAVAVYVRYNNSKHVFFLNQHSDQLLNNVAQLLRKEIIITGPMLIE